MKVSVNNKQIDIFSGATVADALRKYFNATGERKPDGLTPRDQWGHVVDEDAPLKEGAAITF